MLPDATAKSVISYLNHLTSRYGIFHEIRSDNGPCYSAFKLTEFCNKLCARHSTYSPLYSQSNGKSESAVKIIKQLMRKNNNDVFKSVFVHNSTPMASGYSPAQLFLGRKINTDVPTHPSVLAPKWPEFNEVRNKSALNKARQKQ